MDQAALEALLNTLRTAQDGGAPATEPAAAPAPPPPPPLSHATQAPPPPSQSDLDALLSTLTALPSAPASHSSTPPSTSGPSRKRDVSNVAFQEALPLLNSLARDEGWLDRVEEVWDAQKNWELGMKDERNRLEAELSRSGLTPAVKAGRLKEWDRAALRRWTALQSQQQEELQALGVPTFQPTTDPTLLKRQERVVAVLVGMLEDRDG
ncbi:hypothetical protein JCM8097_000088 [Rhodosporidiobolus ruineniae]